MTGRSHTGDYHRLSLAAKQALSRNRMRVEPPVVCPVCETQTPPAELPEHASRCTGPREPAGAKWVSWREALALGVPAMTLSDWAARGAVRVRGERQSREYLLRDLAQRIARRRRKASTEIRTADAVGGSDHEKKSLTRAPGQDPEGGMSSKKTDAYGLVQAEIQAALAAQEPAAVTAAYRRAQLALAMAATGPEFDARRHRAIASALKELARGGKPARGAVVSGGSA